MSKATNVREMINSFNTKPLNEQDIADFYVDTVQGRDCNPSAKLRLLLKNNPTDNRKILFIGHSGSGKSTELNKVALSLEDDYIISQFSIDAFVDYASITYIDVLFAILNVLIETVKKHNYNINDKVLDNIYNYWNDECTTVLTEETEAKIKTEATAKLSFLDMLSTKINSFLQAGYKSRDEIKRSIAPSIPQLIKYMNELIYDIKKKTGEKKILMIIDNLDKLDLETTTDLFVEHSRMITSLDMNIIYTFPIFMFYSQNFMYISPYFDDRFLLSMVKVKKPDGSSNEIGKEILKEIVEKRADLTLFANDVLDFAIEKSGGCIRTLMNLIRNAALESEARLEYYETSGKSNSKISMEDMKHAYSDYRSGMERIIRKEHLKSLQQIYKNNNPIIDNDDIVRDLLMTLAVIEYNGKRWYALNPAIEDYLLEIGELSKNENDNV